MNQTSPAIQVSRVNVTTYRRSDDGKGEEPYPSMDLDNYYAMQKLQANQTEDLSFIYNIPQTADYGTYRAEIKYYGTIDQISSEIGCISMHF